jgi:glycosyltransferase involved in cell wall biosynthesis
MKASGQRLPSSPQSRTTLVRQLSRSEMNVCWISRFPSSERDGKPYSVHAAVRLRTLIPIEAMRANGVVANIATIDEQWQLRDVAAAESCQVAVFDQLYPFGSEQLDVSGVAILEMVDRLQQLGIKTVADIHDNHFGLPGRADYFRRLVQAVDAVVVNSPEMMRTVDVHTRRPIEVVGDPFEGPHGEPTFQPEVRRSPLQRLLRRFFPWSNAPRLELAWFGHPTNVGAVYALMPQLLPLARETPIRLALVSAADSGIEEWCELFNFRHGRYCRIVFVPWSLADTWRVLRDCDMCVLPVDVAKESKSAKSANRLVEALRAGRFVVASPLPAYQEFAASARIDENIVQGIQWALDHQAEVVQRIRTGQDAIEKKYSPAAIALRWQQVIGRLIG